MSWMKLFTIILYFVQYFYRVALSFLLIIAMKIQDTTNNSKATLLIFQFNCVSNQGILLFIV